MSIDTKQVSIIKKIIEVFETGKISDNYGTITVLKDGAGITYGKSQTTDKSDGLDAIILRYIDLNGIFASSLESYLDELKYDLTTKVDPDNLPSWVINLMEILKQAGETDPKMKIAQDQIFDEMYWQPALNQVSAMRLTYPLSYAVVYDTCIHSGPSGVNTIRKLFPEYPPSRQGDEKKWTESYVKARRNWLANFSNPVVKKTVYRQDAFLEMIKDENWNLDKPIKILGVKII